MLDTTEQVIYNSELSSEDLLKIFDNKAIALVIKNYYPAKLCSTLVTKFIENKIEHYENAPSIGRYGMAFYETEEIPDRINRYYAKAPQIIKEIRQLFAPYLSPIDKLRLDLKEVWQYGANIQNLDDRKMFVGLLRLLEPHVEFLPHQDIFHLDATSNKTAYEIKGQIAANIYIKTPVDGGELDLWLTGFHDKEYLDKLDLNSYGINREKLTKHSISLKPEQGDLILFNSRVLHSVKPSSDIRVSLSCFIGFKDIHKPLVYWS